MAKKWAKEEIAALKQQVVKNEDNYKKAFEDAARILDRTPRACASYWYKHLNNDYVNVEKLNRDLDNIIESTIPQKELENISKNNKLSFWEKVKKNIKEIIEFFTN